MLSTASRARMPTIGVGACSATAIAVPLCWARSGSPRRARYTMFGQMFAVPVNPAMKLADWPGSGSVCETQDHQGPTIFESYAAAICLKERSRAAWS